MKEMKLLEAIGNIPSEMLNDALQPITVSRKVKVYLFRFAAACSCVLLLGLFLQKFTDTFRKQPIQMDGSGNGAGTEKNLSDGSRLNHFYMGPVFPMTLEYENKMISAKREITYDFAPYGEKSAFQKLYGNQMAGLIGRYPKLEAAAVVKDEYQVENHSEEIQVLNVVYPFASSYEDLSWSVPDIRVNGMSIKGKLIVGENVADNKKWEDYQGMFRNVHMLSAENKENLDGLTENVSVYKFSSVNTEDCYVHFDIEEDDGQEIRILKEGVNEQYEESNTGEMWYKLQKTDGADKYSKFYFIGGKIKGYKIARKENESKETQTFCVIPNPRIEAEESSMSVEKFLKETVNAHWSEFHQGEGFSEWVTPEQFADSLYKDQLDDYGGWLGELLGATATDRRMFYMAFEITLLPEENVMISAQFFKERSYNVSGYDAGETYDLLTGADGNLMITEQSAVLDTRDAVTVIEQNFGFDKKKRRDRVNLDNSVTHYYMEVVKNN